MKTYTNRNYVTADSHAEAKNDNEACVVENPFRNSSDRKKISPNHESSKWKQKNNNKAQGNTVKQVGKEEKST